MLLPGPANHPRAVVTVLRSSGGGKVFEGGVEGEEEFSHDGGESEFGRFAGGAEATVKRGEDGIVPGGDQGGHVEAGADGAATTKDGAFAVGATAVAVEGSQSGQSGGLAAIERAQFGHFCQEEGRRAGTDPCDLSELLRFGVEVWDFSDELGDEALELRDLFLQGALQALAEAASGGLGLVGTVILVRAQEPAEMAALVFEGAQFVLRWRERRSRRGLQGGTEVAQEARIDPIGLGPLSGGTPILTYSDGLDHADREPCALQRQDQDALVASTGFTDPLERFCAALKTFP